jgi:hypothetical protein
MAHTIAEHPSPSWDYQCYERAARAIDAGRSPYDTPGNCYLYPPPLAVALARVEGALGAGLRATRGEATAESAWPLTLYVFQAARTIWAGCAFVVLYRIARAAGADSLPSALVVATLMIVDVPLYHDTVNNQVNLLVLALAAGAAALVDSAAPLAGLALAVGVVLKLYPALLIPSWLITHRRAAAWTIAWIAALGALVRPWIWWVDFLNVWRTPLSYGALRDNSVRSVMANAARMLRLAPETAVPMWIGIVWLALVAAAFVFGGVRMLRRRRGSAPGGANAGVLAYADMADALAIGLLVSPLAWEHHFVLALPAAVLALVTADPPARVRVWAGAFLVFAVPVADVVFLGASRLVGLCMILSAPVFNGRTAPTAGDGAT